MTVHVQSQREPRFRRADAIKLCGEALARATEAKAIAVVRFPAPAAPLDAMLHGARRGTSILWRPPEGRALAGHGAAVEIELTGAERFEALEAASREVFSAMLTVTHPSCDAAAPRLFGGWSFREGGAGEAPWDGFGDGRFFLPRWTYERTPNGAVLTLTADARDGWPGRLSLVRAELDRVWELLAHPAPGEPPPGLRAVRHQDRESYDAQIAAISEAIASGQLDKVVAARRSEVVSTRDVDAWSALDALSHAYPQTFRFGLRFGGSGTFVGATPERLFAKRGRTVMADALAGTIDAKLPDAAERLRASDKDRREHRVVVEHIVDRLRALCTHLEPPEEPGLRELPNVLHLHTPIRGTLRSDVLAPAICDALFPTPAVGGVPAAAATQWIAEHEPHDRGWYCGPVGWIDADGDAEYAVALRCGLIRGASAWLYAGGGIVRGSRAEAEWEEAAWKLAPLLRALGG